VTPADVAQAVPLTQDPAFRSGVIALLGALTALAGIIGGWFMRESKTKRESASAPGADLRRAADAKLAKVEGEVKELTRGLADLSEKADDLARGVENAADKIQDLDDKVDTAAVKVAELARDMDWVKRYLESIGRKLGI
jgi:chromosome segregation ATPase